MPHPGCVLAGRYRLEDCIDDRLGARSWRAVDEVLRRSVAVEIISADAPRAAALVNAARRSAAVHDTRFLRVLDAAQEDGHVYVVREWTRGESLDRVLADGPLTHRRAAWVVREIAQALLTAHHNDIYHWRLIPENIILTDTGAVRIIGLATEAALENLRYVDAEAEAEDVRGLGRLLYAALVNRWPGGDGSDLPPAPTEHGRLLRPRQVRAGVPRPLDDICDRILGDPPRHHAEPIRTVAELTSALAEAAGLATDAVLSPDPEATQVSGFGAVPPAPGLRTRPPGAFGMPPGPAGPVDWNHNPEETSAEPTAPVQLTGRITLPGNQHGDTNGTGTGPVATTVGGAGARPLPPPDDAGGRGNRWLVTALTITVVAVGAFLLGYLLTDHGGSSGLLPGGGDAVEPGADPTAVHITSARAWDPYGEDGENDEQARLAVDGKPGTAWTTMTYYNRAAFGGLKPGLGLVLDLGKPVSVSQVRVNLGGDGTDLQIRVAPENARTAPSSPDDYAVRASADAVKGTQRLALDEPATTQYVLVWLTKLPGNGSDFRGQVNEVAVLG